MTGNGPIRPRSARLKRSSICTLKACSTTTQSPSPRTTQQSGFSRESGDACYRYLVLFGNGAQLPRRLGHDDRSRARGCAGLVHGRDRGHVDPDQLAGSGRCRTVSRLLCGRKRRQILRNRGCAGDPATATWRSPRFSIFRSSPANHLPCRIFGWLPQETQDAWQQGLGGILQGVRSRNGQRMFSECGSRTSKTVMSRPIGRPSSSGMRGQPIPAAPQLRKPFHHDRSAASGARCNEHAVAAPRMLPVQRSQALLGLGLILPGLALITSLCLFPPSRRSGTASIAGTDSLRT